MVNKLTKHLKENNITYAGHFGRSLSFSFIAFCASVIFLVHAIFPFLFETTGSTIIRIFFTEKWEEK